MMDASALREAPETLQGGLRGLFGPQVSVALTDPARDYGSLLDQELEAMAGACGARRLEFAAGRCAARRAMQAAGLRPGPVLQGRDRAPVWPAGVVGTISHCATACAAAVADAQALGAVGLDIEPAAALEPDLLPVVCTLAERAWLAVQPEAERGTISMLIFSAKESAFKCQYPLSGAMFDFQTLEITPDLDLGHFEATFLRPVPCFDVGTCLHGRFAVADGHFLTGVTSGRRPRWTPRGRLA